MTLAQIEKDKVVEVEKNMGCDSRSSDAGKRRCGRARKHERYSAFKGADREASKSNMAEAEGQRLSEL